MISISTKSIPGVDNEDKRLLDIVPTQQCRTDV